MDVSVREGRYYQFEDFVLDPTRRTLTRGGAPVSLTPTLFDTLLYLVEHPGEVVTRDQLLDAIWPRKTVDTANVSQTIFTLRRALGAAGAHDQLIATAPGAGYRFVHPVQVVSSKAGADASIDPVWPLSAQPGRPSRPRLAWVVWTSGAALLVIAAAAIGAWFWRAPTGPPTHSLVLLGAFQNLAHDPQFDQTLQMATQIDLQQSPYVQVLSQQQIADTLALMTRPPDAALSPAVEREVCERNNGAATVDGTVAEIGAKYLLTLTATDCASGDVIAADKAEVDRRDDLLPSLDRLVGELRSRLGEPSESIQHYNAPLLQRRTASLAALQAYSLGVHDFAHGKRIEAIPLFQQAIALDPGFSAAYADLAVVYSNLHQDDLAAASIKRAYDLRGAAGDQENLVISARYNTFVTGDIPEGLRIYRSWTQIYPNDAMAWANLANKETWTGQDSAAIEDGRRALALGPESEVSYVVLARALLHAGRLDEAQAVCAQAVAHHVDGDDLHGLLYEIAIARSDDTAAAQQLQWAAGKPGARTLLIEAGQAAFGRGQVRRGLDLFAQANALGQSFGLGDIFSAPNARLLFDLGREDLARQTLAHVPAGYDSADYRFSLAEFGDAEHEAALLAADVKKTPANTLLTQVFAAEEHAAAALRRRQPAAAIAALQSATPYDLRTLDVPYLRGRAYLAAGDGAHAAAEFQKILDNRGVESVSEYCQLAHLGLARALRLQGDAAGARKAYEAFFRDWQGADPGMPLLAAARTEYAGLKAR
jgi:DNA-binding winged helix-turn-helix (wHTH) protein/tetratricopeptide (TPR) repeat protein